MGYFYETRPVDAFINGSWEVVMRPVPQYHAPEKLWTAQTLEVIAPAGYVFPLDCEVH